VSLLHALEKAPIVSDNRIIIIGGGISGLTVAWELARRGREVVLLERRDVLGGLARSVPLNGKPLEVYYHFICGGDRHLVKLVTELGLSDRLHWRPGRTSYFVNGRLYPFTTPIDLLRFSPLSLTGRLRFGLHALHCRRLTDWRRLEHLSAEQWLIDSVGRQAYEVIWRPLLEVKFGRDHDKIAAPWIWHRIHRYSQSRSSLLRPEQFGYLEGGSHALLTALQGSITAQGGGIRTGVEAFSLNYSGQRIEGVETSSGYYEADRVVAAVPLPELVRLLPGDSEHGRRLSQIQFTSVACVRLALRHSLTDSFWVNVNAPDVAFNGCIEYSNLNPWREYGGRNVLYVPFYFDSSDERNEWPDSRFIESAIQGLRLIQPEFAQGWVEEAMLSRDRYGQAICPPGFGERVPALRAPTEGLYVLDSTQLYPADRNLSGMIRLARSVGEMVAGEQ